MKLRFHSGHYRQINSDRFDSFDIDLHNGYHFVWVKAILPSIFFLIAIEYAQAYSFRTNAESEMLSQYNTEQNVIH